MGSDINGHHINDGPPKPVNRFRRHRGGPHPGRSFRHTAEDNCDFKTRPNSPECRAQLVQPPVEFDHPGTILGQSHFPKHAGTHRDQATEVVIIASGHRCGPFRSLIPSMMQVSLWAVTFKREPMQRTGNGFHD